MTILINPKKILYNFSKRKNLKSGQREKKNFIMQNNQRAEGQRYDIILNEMPTSAIAY
jgi:hypothetical protein